MVDLPPSMAGAPAHSPDAQAFARFTASLWARLGGSRIGFTVAVCALTSTQALFQPSLYEPIVPERLVHAWLDYFGECLLMGVPIMVAVTVVETLAPGHPRGLVIPVVAAALAGGAIVGALALIP